MKCRCSYKLLKNLVGLDMLKSVRLMSFCILLLVICVFLISPRYLYAHSLTSLSLNLDDLWRSYKKNNIVRQPSREFPYMNCFRQSARRHNVPLTMLLAVARGESDFNPKSVAQNKNTGNCLWYYANQMAGNCS